MPQSEEEHATPPDTTAVKRRASILLHIFTKALATPPETVVARFDESSMAVEKAKLAGGFEEMFQKQREKLRSGGLWEDMEESEREFMNAGIFETSTRQRINASWMAESILCLLWALGLKEQIPAYDQQYDLRSDTASGADRLRDANQNAALRPQAEIEQQRDQAEMWHWRCRTHRLLTAGQIPDALPDGTPMTEIIRMTAEKAAEEGVFAQPIGGDFPVFGKAFREISEDELGQLTSIAMERHKAMNWLSGYAPGNRWSKTPTDT
jgi:hypothetical protein